MKNNISILSSLLPRYGEILIAIGAIVSSNSALSENEAAVREIKDYLIGDVYKVKDANGLAHSKRLQKIMCDYLGIRVGVMAIKNQKNIAGTTNIYLADFFGKSVWPIIVDKYIDKICTQNIDVVHMVINVKKRVYTTIYGDGEEQTFFKEFKQFLIDNYIVVSKAQMKENGDMLLEFLVPVAM